MAEYTLLESPSSRNTRKRKWAIAALMAAIVIPSSFITYKYHKYTLAETNNQEELPFTTIPPARSFNFTVPDREHEHFIDLDKYPVEDTVLKLFPDTAAASLASSTVDKILDQNLEIPWTEKWLDRSEKDDQQDTLSCSKQTLPYPILRQIVLEYSPDIQNPDSFFDDSSVNFSQPFVFLPYLKQPKLLVPGHKICVRVVVPYQNVGQNDKYRLLYKPYTHNNAQLTSPWWDTTLTTLTNLETNATIPIKLQPWSGHLLLRQNVRDLTDNDLDLPDWVRWREDEIYERERMHVYEADMVVPEPGKYKLSSLLEFVEARYNFEYGAVTPYKPTDLPVFPIRGEIITVANPSRNQSSTRESLAESLLNEHLRLPLCAGTSNPGRWLPYPKGKNKEEAITKVSGLTRDGKYWAPYSCRYQHISYESFNRCAAKKLPGGIDLYGDSNIRRSLKKFISHGQWCKNWEKYIDQPLLPENEYPIVKQILVATHAEKRDVIFDMTSTTNTSTASPSPETPEEPIDLGIYNSPQEYKHSIPEQTRSCFCEDFTEPYWNSSWFDSGMRRNDLELSNSPEQAAFLGVTKWDNTNISTTPFDRDSVKISSYKWDGLTYFNSPEWYTAVPSMNSTASVAIFSLSNWDAAFAELDPFMRDLDRLVEQIKSHYDLSKTKIIYRTAQFYCCRVDNSQRNRQVSGPRLDVFESIVQDKFVKELQATMWDTYSMGESKSWDEKILAISCSSNHAPADQVELENQVLMNSLCNKA